MQSSQAQTGWWSRVVRCQLSERWIFGFLAVFFVIVNIQCYLKVSKSDRPTSQTAFQRWTPQVLELDDEVDIWEKYIWPNTPMMALILKPFMEVEWGFLGPELWILFKMACAAASLYLVFRMLDRPEHPFPFWGKALAAFLSLRPIEGDLVHGNVNLFILFTVVLGAYALTRHWDAAAGFSLALGIACKITPALFVPYLVWKRAWKALAATCVGLVVWLLIVPGSYFGFQQNWAYLNSWLEKMVVPYVVKMEITSEHQNQSLPGFLERMLRDRPSISQTNEERTDYETLAKHNFVNLSREQVGMIVKAFLGLFCLAVMWRCRAPLNDRQDWRWVAEFGVIVMGMLIFNERTWKHHAVTLMIPFAVIAHQISAFQLPRGRRNYLVGTMVVAAILITSTVSGLLKPFGVPDERDVFGKFAQVYGVYLWSFVALMTAMFALAGQKENFPLAKVEPLDDDAAQVPRAA